MADSRFQNIGRRVARLQVTPSPPLADSGQISVTSAV